MIETKFLGLLRNEKIGSNLLDDANKQILVEKGIISKDPNNDPEELIRWSFFDDDEYHSEEENNTYAFNFDFINEIYNVISFYAESENLDYLSYNLNNVEVNWIDVKQKINLAVNEERKKEIAQKVYDLLNEENLEKKLESLRLDVVDFNNDFDESYYLNLWSNIKSIFKKPQLDATGYSLSDIYALRRLYFDFLNRNVDNNWKEWVFYGILYEPILKGYLMFDPENEYMADELYPDNFPHALYSFIHSLKFKKYDIVDIWSNFYNLNIINNLLLQIIKPKKKTTKKSSTLKDLFLDKKKYDYVIKSLIDNDIIKKTNKGLKILVPEEFKNRGKETFICSIGIQLSNKNFFKICHYTEIVDALNNEFSEHIQKQHYDYALKTNNQEKYLSYTNLL